MDNHDYARFLKRLAKELARVMEIVTEQASELLQQENKSDSARVSISDEAKKRKEVK